MELGHSTLESVKTGTKTPNYMAMKVLELALESIPMSIIQLYVLIKDYTEWDQPSLRTEENRPKILLFLSICFSFLSVMQTAAMMTLENEDSAWKGLLEGSTGMVIALFYYVGDVWTHIGIFAVFAYTHNEYLPVALSAMLFTMFVLLRLALGSSVMGIGRAILLSPLMMFVDFPLKPDKTTGLHNDWMWQRTLPISTAMFLVLATVMYVVPVQELPNYDHTNIGEDSDEHGTLADRLLYCFGIALVVKFSAFVLIMRRKYFTPKLPTQTERTRQASVLKAMDSVAMSEMSPRAPDIGQHEQGRISTNPLFSEDPADPEA